MRRRNIALACGHEEGLATLEPGQQTAWCPVCEASVDIGDLNCRACGGTGLDPELALKRRAWEPWVECAVCEGAATLLPQAEIDLSAGAAAGIDLDADRAHPR